VCNLPVRDAEAAAGCVTTGVNDGAALTQGPVRLRKAPSLVEMLQQSNYCSCLLSINLLFYFFRTFFVPLLVLHIFSYLNHSNIKKFSFFRNRGELLFIFQMFQIFVYWNTFVIFNSSVPMEKIFSWTLKSLQYLHIFSKFSNLIFLMFR